MPNTQPKTKRYASGNDLFLFYIFCIVTKKTGNTGAEKLRGRTHPMMHGVYLLYKPFEGDSRKSYGEGKTNLNSTNNTACIDCQKAVSASWLAEPTEPKLTKHY
jgi:hypothetical protein